MPLVINTNIASLNAQRNLDQSSAGYATCLQRLSSGLRINSAADDAAGLAIATRMQSNISGLTVAKRNSNDAISLSQIAEGALQETTNILQRIRELAVQSANGTNASQDRYALNSEVNQLKDQLALSASQTSFNGLKLLDGSLAAAAFQIGPDQNQSVTISIGNTSTNQIGVNDLSPSGVDGIEQANYGTYMEANVIAQSAAATNGLGVTTFRFNVQPNNLLVAPTVINTAPTIANASASYTAKQINGTLPLNGLVTASAYTDVLVSNFVYGAGGTVTMNIKDSSGGAGGAVVPMVVAANSTPQQLAMQINNTPAISAIGVYAINEAAGVRIISPQGHDISFALGAGGAPATFSLTQYYNAVNGASTVSSTVLVNALSQVTTAHGILALEMAQNVTLNGSVLPATTLNDTASVFFNTAQQVYSTGFPNTIATNRFQAQILTVSGNNGIAIIPVGIHTTAESLAILINNQSGVTTVSAKASTVVSMQNVSVAGTVSFHLYGDNTVTPVTINASVTPTDYSNLVRAINDYSGTTGITALANAATGIVMSNISGKDIRITDFEHSAGVAPANVITSPLGPVDGSTLLVPSVASIDIIGNPLTNSGSKTIKLFAGGARSEYDSTVIGGTVLMSSAASFSVDSSVDGNSYSGSLFSGAALASQGSTFTSIAQIDISTAPGAISSLRVLDQALDQISSIRAQLGAVQSRFDSIIRNIADSIENLSSAKARVLDADFAAETSELSKTQILTQAGLSIVAQANKIPQSILTLLQ